MTLGLSSLEEDVLTALRQLDGWAPAWWLAKQCGSNSPQTAAALRNLRRQGLVCRTPGKWMWPVMMWRFGA